MSGVKIDGWYNDDPAEPRVEDEIEIVALDEASMEDYPSVLLDDVVSEEEASWPGYLPDEFVEGLA